MTEMRDAINFVGFWGSPPSPDATILNYLNDSEGGGAPLSFVGFGAPPPQMPQYLTRGGGAPLLFVGFWHLPMTPPPDDTILNYLNDREGGAPLCRILTPPNAPPPPYDSKILYYLNDRDEGLLIL